MKRSCLIVLSLCAFVAGQVHAGDAKVHTVGKDGLKIEGSIADNDPKLKVTEPNVNVTVDLTGKVHQVKLQAGVKYRMDLKGPDIDAILAVQDESGKQVAFDDDSGGGLDSRLDYQPAKDGTYKIITATLKGAGAFTLTIVATGGGPAVAAKDVKIDGQVALTDEKVNITNAALDKKLGVIKGNQTVALPAALHEIKLDGDKTYQLDAVAKDKVDPVIVVQDSTGKQLGFDDDGGGFPNARLVLKTTKADTYKVYVATIGGQGKYVLTVKDIGGGGVPGKALDVGAGGLKLNGKINQQARTVGYLVKMEAGKAYVIDMTSPDQKALDPYLKLFDNGGKLLMEDDDGGDDLNARMTFRPTESGTYRIVATSFLGVGNGEYTLTVRIMD